MGNTITVAVDGYPCSSLIVSTDNGSILEGENAGHFMINPIHPGDLYVTVKANTPKGIKVLGVKHYRVKCPPPPTIYVLGKYKGTISAKLIHSAIAPGAVQENMEIDVHIPITDFTIQVIRDDKEIFNKQIHNTKGVRFNDDAATQKMIETLQPNDKLIIKDIVYTYFIKSCASEVNTINLTITE